MGSLRVSFVRAKNDFHEEPNALGELARAHPSVAVDVLDALHDIMQEAHFTLAEMPTPQSRGALERYEQIERTMHSASSNMYKIAGNDEITSAAPDVIPHVMNLSKELMINKIADGVTQRSFNIEGGPGRSGDPLVIEYKSGSPLHSYFEAAKQNSVSASKGIAELQAMAVNSMVDGGMAAHYISSLGRAHSGVASQAHDALTNLIEQRILHDSVTLAMSPDIEQRDNLIYQNPGKMIAEFAVATEGYPGIDAIALHKQLDEWGRKGLVSKESTLQGRKILERETYQLAKYNFEHQIDVNQDVDGTYHYPKGKAASEFKESYTTDSSLLHMVKASVKNHKDSREAMGKLQEYAEQGLIDHASAAYFIAGIGASNVEYGRNAMEHIDTLMQDEIFTTKTILINGSAVYKGYRSEALVQLTNNNILISPQDTAQRLSDLYYSGAIDRYDMDYGQQKVGHMPLDFQNTAPTLAPQLVIDGFYNQPSRDVHEINKLSMRNIDPNAEVHTNFDGYHKDQSPNRYAIRENTFTSQEAKLNNSISFDNDILFETGVVNVDVHAAGNILIAGDVVNSELDSNAMNIEAPINKIVIAGDVKEHSYIHMSGRYSRLEIMGDVGSQDAQIHMSGYNNEVFIHGTLHPDATINAARIVYDIASGMPKVKEGNNLGEAQVVDAAPDMKPLEKPPAKLSAFELN